MSKKNFANYEILRKLGEGGMGAVYLARDLNLEREVAIKIIAPELSLHERLISRFRVEAIAQAKLNHTNIVTIHSFSQEKNIYYIVMEYVDGKSLNAILKENLPMLQSLNIFSQILEGISYAHSKGVVHRDIKPANVFLTTNQITKIGDFGIAKVEGIEGITRVGSAIGSPVYSSPEQLLGETLDNKTDIYSLGITLYEMLTGKSYLKITGDTDYTAIKKAIEYKPPKPSTVNPEIPASLDSIVMKSIAKDPNHRFQNVNEFHRELKQLISSLTESSEAPTVDLNANKLHKEKSIPKTLMFNKKQIVIASVSFVLIFITLILLIFSGGSNSSNRTTLEKSSVNITHPNNVKSSSNEHSKIKSLEETKNKSREITLAEDMGPLAEILTEMNWHIKNRHFQVANNLGKETIRKGTTNADIYLLMAQSYYCDGKKRQSRNHYMKALEYEKYLKFNVSYQLTQDILINGTLGISRQDIIFTPSDASSNRYSFSLKFDMIGDIIHSYNKKRDNDSSKLIISVSKKNKYTLLIGDNYKKLGSFAKDIINTLKKMK